MESKEFKNLKGFRKAYDQLREDILARHGYATGDAVRLNKVIMLYQNFNGQWLQMTTVKSSMEERIKMYEGQASFKLQTLV